MKGKIVKDALKVLRKNKPDLIARNKVRRTGIGFKIKNGKVTDEVGIVIFVRYKPSVEALLEQRTEPVPKEIEGYKTDIINIPTGFTPRLSPLLLTSVLPDDLRHRPFSGGVAIINSTGEPATGTLGLIVNRSGGSSNKLCAITNNHVGANEDVEGLSTPSARKGDPITQPGAHGGGRVPGDVIANLSEWNKLKPSSPTNVNYYDFAMAEITTESTEMARPYEVMDIGKVRGIEDIQLGDKVMKRGRTTQKTIGRVTAVAVETTVDYQGYPCNFVDQVAITGIPETTPFSLPGDSGSVIVSADKNSRSNSYGVKALLFAGGRGDDGIDHTIASPIRRIADDFDLKI
jgi:hypothetical protein